MLFGMTDGTHPLPEPLGGGGLVVTNNIRVPRRLLLDSMKRGLVYFFLLAESGPKPGAEGGGHGGVVEIWGSF